MTFTLTSPAFQQGGAIPAPHTCDGTDVSPALHWEGAPEGVASFALIVDDPDAPSGTFVHWVLYDVPGHATELPENVGPSPELENLGETRQGKNGFGGVGYKGPCPPAGGPHRYFFRLYALDARLGLAPGAPRDEVEGGMEGHVLGAAELMGTYQR
jgi:Raf kinase inhibitor-like YbhB/YbcL family protein